MAKAGKKYQEACKLVEAGKLYTAAEAMDLVKKTATAKFDESIELTKKTGTTWFWSRSRQELWNKGATSGNVQHVRQLYYDCDGDTLLAKVDAEGPACHTGNTTCFFRTLD